MVEKEKRCHCGRELFDDKYCIFHSPKTDKDAKLFQTKLNEIFAYESLKSYNFELFVFPAGISFPKEIDKSVGFSSAVFLGRANFRSIIFKEKVHFMNTTFQSLASFECVNFHAQVSFASATFKDDAWFVGAIFDNEAKFLKAVFEKKTFFGGTTFKGSTDFWDVTFEDTANFGGVTFEDALIIDQELKNGVFSSAEVDFRSVRFLKPELVRFRKVDLSKFRFLSTDLRKVEFINVLWYKKRPRWLSKRDYRGVNAVYDEVKEDPDTGGFDYPLITNLYKSIRSNYEEKLYYADAGDFYIGEMDCKRKSYKNWFGRWLCLTALYDYVSHYGEGFRRTFYLWLLPMIILFPILFMYTGLEGVTESQIPYLIHYDFDLRTISLNKAGDWVIDYWNAFLFNISVISRIGEKQYKPVNGYSWMVIESILGPVLIAFFLLALRRRFRR